MDSFSLFLAAQKNTDGSTVTPADDSTSASSDASSSPPTSIVMNALSTEFSPPRSSVMNALSTEFTPLAFQAHTPNELISLLGQQEPRPGDTAPSSIDIDEMIRSFSINGAESAFEVEAETVRSQPSNYFAGNSRPESVASSSQGNLWSDVTPTRPTDQYSTFEFLVKSVSAANNYVSMLTRDQLSVMRSLRPSLLYEFLQEVARVRSEKRTRRALPSECAFCKNNGENEDHYMSHALKDWRGRVLCPVLRAFRCPRCGATGDRAHTIKYCPEIDSERPGQSRRRPSAALLMNGFREPGEGQQFGAPPPSPSHNDIVSGSNLWSNFGRR